MSLDQSVPDTTDTVKENVLEMLDVPVQVDVTPPQVEPIDPQAAYQQVKDRFDKANAKLVVACQILAAGKTPFIMRDYCPEADKTSWDVQRYLPGLNRKEATLDGKEAKKYRTVLKTATGNLDKLVELAKKHFELAKKTKERAQKDVDEQELIVKGFENSESEANLLLKKLVIPAQSGHRQMVVDKSALELAQTRKTDLQKKKEKDQDKVEIAYWQKVLDKKSEFERLAKEFTTAKENKEASQKTLELKKGTLNSVVQAETKRLKAYTDKYNAVKKTIDLLIASGNSFAEDHSGFLTTLGEIDVPTKRDAEYEEGIELLAALEKKVKAAADELQKKVTSAADLATNELAAVKDPEDLAGDPVRKKRLDDAREVIAKRLREPLVGTDVVAARSEIPEFEKLAKEIDEELKARPDQVITCTKEKLVYGEPLSALGAKTSGDGTIELIADDKTKLAATFLPTPPSKTISILAGPTTNFKTATKEVTIDIEQDTPTILWRKPIPVLQNSRLTAFTLNATLQSSFKQPVNLPLTYAPALNALMNVVRDVSLKASFAGNGNYKAAADKEVTLKVVANATEMGKEAMLSGAAWQGPVSFRDKQLLDRWNTDDSPTGIKKQAQQVMSDTQNMTGDELIDYMDKFINPTGTAPIGTRTDDPMTNAFPNFIWELPNGMQVRYKPRGDGRPPVTIPPTPMFCVEGKTCAGRSGSDSDVAFKVTSGGNPAAYGKNQTTVPPSIPSNSNDPQHKQYMDAACGTTHLRCKPKVEQTITWASPPDIAVGDKLGADSLKPQAQDATALEFTDGTGTPITQDTVLPAGNDQVLRVKGKETLRYLASANFVEVKINVKKVQAIDWTPPKEIAAGTKLGSEVLNAKAEDNAVLSYFYNDGKTDTPLDVDTVLAAGDGLTLKVVAAATTDYLAVTTPITKTIDVKKRPQSITWAPVKELSAGDTLESVLTATTTSGDAPSYADEEGTPVEKTTVLPAGTHKLTAAAQATDVYHAAEPVTVTITVKPKEKK